MVKLIDKIDIFDRGYIELWDFSKANSSSASRIEAAAKIAMVCRNLESIKNPLKLYHKLLHEHAGEPSEVIQFIPVMDNVGRKEFDLEIRDYRFGDIDSDGKFRTNLRNYVNPLKVMYCDSVNGFYVFKLKLPVMSVAHITRHGQLSCNQMSERHVKAREYYMPRELTDVLGKEDWDSMIYRLSQKDFDCISKSHKIRQELTNKGSHGLAYTKLWVAGWIQDKSTWNNFFNVRLKNQTQFETRTIASAMYQLIRTHDKALAYKYIGARHV